PVAGAAASDAATGLSARTPIRSVVSLTKGPSLERTSACLARRPVVLSGSGPYGCSGPGAVVRLMAEEMCGAKKHDYRRGESSLSGEMSPAPSSGACSALL